MIKIPDGSNPPIFFMKGKIIAIRDKPDDPGKSYLWAVDNSEPWVLDCDIDRLLRIIKMQEYE